MDTLRASENFMVSQIQLIEQHGAAALVEWNDTIGVHRATIPVSDISPRGETQVAELSRLEEGIPYGAAWELLPIGRIGPDRIADALRRRGIWTLTDARERIHDVKAALQDACSADLKTILELTRTQGG